MKVPSHKSGPTNGRKLRFLKLFSINSAFAELIPRLRDVSWQILSTDISYPRLMMSRHQSHTSPDFTFCLDVALGKPFCFFESQRTGNCLTPDTRTFKPKTKQVKTFGPQRNI